MRSDSNKLKRPMRPWTLYNQRLFLKFKLSFLKTHWAILKNIFKTQAEIKKKDY